MSARPAHSDHAATLAEASLAWRSGDLEGCIECCEADAGMPESDALRARALLRLRRFGEALSAVEPHAHALDPRLRAEVQALAGSAMVLGGALDDGTRLLREASRDRAADGATRAEATLGIALALFRGGDYASAAAALDEIGAAADITFARALELRGWIEKRCGRLGAALAAFQAALEAFDRCVVFDRFVEANVVMAIGNLAVEVLDLEAWRTVSRRAQHVRWEAPGLAFYRFWNDLNRSMADELDGRPRDALVASRDAAAAAPSAALRVFARCRHAAVLLAYGEVLGYEDHATAIHAEFEALDLASSMLFEEINAAVVVAETLALMGDGARAAAAMERIAQLSPVQRTLLTDEPVKQAYLTFVEGLVADAGSETFLALHRYRAAFRAFAALGMTRRALLAALRLDAVDHDDEAARYIAAHALALPRGSWIREDALRRAAWETDAVLSRLTRGERDVLMLLYDGMSTAEIAERRARSAQTVRNTISRVLKAFHVSSRQALITELRRRGLPDLRRSEVATSPIDGAHEAPH